MAEILLFGGTSEGRTLAELLKKKGVLTCVCVATGYGEALLSPGGSLSAHTGRLDADGIAALIKAERPRLAIDATHPYARAVGENLRAACAACNTAYLRVRRMACPEEGAVLFDGMGALIRWLDIRPGVIFSMLGAKEAAALTAVTGYRERIFLRILPAVESLTACLEAGFPAKHILCMQGPFSEEMNVAMLRAANAKILVTKESGAAGGLPEKLAAAKKLGIAAAVLRRPGEAEGFPEKLAAAKKLGIAAAVLRRPGEAEGCTLEELIQRIEEGAL